ncbi:MAG: RodZ domain-containing protein [Burkholderiales bacterium]
MTSAVDESGFGVHATISALGDPSASSREADVGEVLARERMAHGFTIEDVAQQLKFAPRQIEALEQGHFDRLPGGTFARGMLRSYARLLKLDADALLARVEDRFDIPDSGRLAARFNQAVPFSDASRRSNVIYAVLSVLILAAVAGVLIEWQHERANPARLTFVAAAKAPLEPSPATVASAAPDKMAAPVQAVKVPAAPAVEKAPSAQAAPDVQPAPAVQAMPATAPVATTVAAGADTRRIIMQFDEESWVEARDAAGRTLMAQLVPAGSRKVIQGQPPFALVIGNAQHVQVVYRDKPFDLKPYTRVDVARFTLK